MAAAAARFASLLAEAEDDEPVKPTLPPDNPAGGSDSKAGVESAESPAQKKETRAMVIARHAKELAEVEEQCRQKISESKKKNKIIREAVQTECAEIKRACIVRHDRELAAVPRQPGDDAEIVADISKMGVSDEADGDTASGEAGFGYRSADGKKKGKQQKRKEAKAAEEQKRYQEAKDSLKDWVDPKDVEDRQLQAKLAPLKLRVHSIPSDGHCMYRAILDQCQLHIGDANAALADELASGALTFTQLRHKAADFMRRHPDDFAPFMADDDLGGGGGDGDGDIFTAYLAKLTDTAEWGGNLELTALARALPAHLHVYSAAADDLVFSPDRPSACALHLHLSFHRHAFGLGEHYNSLHPAVE